MKSKFGKLLFLMLLMQNFMVVAQDYKLGKVTVDELKEKNHPGDTSARAAILHKKQDIYFQIDGEGYWQLVTETEVKIKIYKKEGYNLANVQEIYYDFGKGEKVTFSNAVTYNLVNGQVEKTKLKSDGEFKEKYSKYYSVKKITLPNVKEGTIIEYKVTKQSYNLTRLADYYFQFDIPVKYIDLRVTVPEYYVYNRVLMGYLNPKVSEEVLNSSVSNLKNYRTLLQLNDVPALKDEKYVNNINNYRSRIRFELSSRRTNTGSVEDFATDWPSVAKKIYEEDDFGKELQKTGYFEDEINAVIKGVTNRNEKIMKIFDYVKQRMNWNEYNSLFCDVGVKEAFKNKTGNAAEINLMLTAMLRYAGVEANPVILSTRSNGIAFLPSRTAFNYVVCGVEYDNRISMFDATSKYSMSNIMPARTLNWVGRVIRKNGTSDEIDLMVDVISKNSTNVFATLQTNGELNGKLREVNTEYAAYMYREDQGKYSKETVINNLERKYKGIEVDGLKVMNVEDLYQPIQVEYEFNHNNVVEIIGSKMYFSPFLFLNYTENPFTQEKREYPIDFLYPRQDKYTFTITIPEGYEIESLPKATNLSIIDDLGAFKFNCLGTGNKIQVSATFDLNQSTILPQYYVTLKDFFKRMLEVQNDKIVLKKT